jgi:hypothetical protein
MMWITFGALMLKVMLMGIFSRTIREQNQYKNPTWRAEEALVLAA